MPVAHPLPAAAQPTNNATSPPPVPLGARLLRSTSEWITSGSDVDVIETWGSWNREYMITGYNYTTSAIYTANAVTDSSAIWSDWSRQYTATTANRVMIDSTSYDPLSDTHTVVWRQWNNSYVPTPAQVVRPAVWAETPAQIAERAAREQERVAASVRAQALLESVLNEEQRRDWAARGHFFLHVGEKKYRIKRGRSGNVELVDQNNEPLERYCAHPVDLVPDEDTAVAQMLHLLYDEDRFLAMANVHWTKPGFQGQRRKAA